MQRVLITLAAVVAVVLGVAPTGGAATTVESSRCPYGTVAALVTLTVADDAVTGVTGAEWARGAYTKTILVYRLGPRTWCAVTRDTGGFVTEAGLSPAGTSYVAGGISGSLIRSTRSWIFTADWRPVVPTMGSIGTSTTGDWLPLFFANVSGYGDAWYANVFNTGLSCMTFSVFGVSGDITL
ncbi:MAG TPA: hypothetical protein VGJ77_00980 [Gaiellaceae bacterium]|jgi:hypothetical protein